MVGLVPGLVLSLGVLVAKANLFGVRDDLHFSLEARQENRDGSRPVHKNPRASIEARVNDLLPRMTLEEKVAQLYVLNSFLPLLSDIMFTPEFRAI